MSSKVKSNSTKATTPQKESSKPTQSTATLEAEQGFRGVGVDPTPNVNYTVSGVLAGLPTPETNLAAAKAARKATGLGISGLEAAELERVK